MRYKIHKCIISAPEGSQLATPGQNRIGHERTRELSKSCTREEAMEIAEMLHCWLLYVIVAPSFSLIKRPCSAVMQEM
uniref:Uncharacterized protein n=1 Tax=Oryza brachyantha TaxID=4533 RepID=J3MPX7_ORYBR